MKRAASRLLRVAAAAALAWLAACTGSRGPAGPYPGLAPYAGREIRSVRLVGDSLRLPTDSVLGVVSTRPSSCELLGVLPVCVFGRGRTERFLDLGLLSRDVVRIQLLYRDNGYYGTRVVPDVQEAPEDRVDVRFRVTPGDLVRLQSFEVVGAEGILDSARLARRLPLGPGDPFRRIDFLASVDTVRNALLNRGRAYAQVLRNFDIDTVADVARVQLQAAPGPLVTVDTVLVAGNYRLSERTVRGQLPFREGRRLRATALARGQRNLFDLELVSFAAVEVAPESLQITPDSLQLLEDSIGSTVQVRLMEAARYAVDASAGYGSEECFRARAAHTDRNFLGGARRLQVSGLLSKIGVAKPFELGLEDFPCDNFRPPGQLLTEQDTVVERIVNAINYRVAVDFVQPRLFGTRTSFVAGGFAEQVSELNLYLRRSRGASVGAVRQVARGAVVSATVTARYGETVAQDFFYCLVQEVCREEDIGRLEEGRFTNTFSLGLLSNRVRLNPFPESGFQLRAQADYASRFLASDDRFVRLYLDGVLHREIADGYVLSARLAGGTFLEGLLDVQGYVPPEYRFYGGGATHVRGYGRNALGPTVHVDRIRRDAETDTVVERDPLRSATGGTRSLLASLEFTAPSPVLPQNLRVAAFVDAGQVWDGSRRDDEEGVPRPGLRFTPGVGARIATPVGPMRFDLAYNGYGPEPGPLFELDRGELRGPVQLDYRPADDRSFLQRLTLQFSVGQGF